MGADPYPHRQRLSGDQIRVGLIVEQAAVELEAVGSFDIRDARGRRLFSDFGAGKINVRAASKAMVFGGESSVAWKSDEPWLLLDPHGQGIRWKAKGNVYGGKMILRRTGEDKLSLIHLVDIEEYLRGVVPWEIGRPGRAALEAVKAQAVAARTYAIAHLSHWEELGFDVWDSQSDQVFRGLHGIDDICDQAIQQTSGKVMMIEGKLIRAYYSSTCGGHGSSIQDVWPKSAVSYLTGKRDADGSGKSWCSDSAQFRWSEGWSARELGAVIRENLPLELDPELDARSIGILQGLEVLARDPSGRVQTLRIRTDQGEFDVWGDRIRWVLRPLNSRFGILRSTLFEVENIRRDGKLVAIRLKGGGFGHGVGLCQTGALAMARAGKSYRAILEHYYTGVKVEDIHSARIIP